MTATVTTVLPVAPEWDCPTIIGVRHAGATDLGYLEVDTQHHTLTTALPGPDADLVGDAPTPYPGSLAVVLSDVLA